MNRILIIEDDETICDIIGDVLNKFGRIHKAHNKHEALELISKYDFKVIIVDYYLGEARGLDLITSSQKDMGHTPIILISAQPSVEMLEAAIEFKVMAFMKKPIDFDILIKKVESLFLEVNYQFEGIRITLLNDNFKIFIDQEEIQLTEIQFKMMKYFLENHEKTIEREKMTSYIWGAKKVGSDNALDTHLLNLKKKVPLLREHLITLPRVGYKFSLSTK